MKRKATPGKPTEQAARGAAETETDLTWLPLFRCGKRSGWGRDYMTLFVKLGAPSVAGKLSVKALHDWLVANAATIPKI